MSATNSFFPFRWSNIYGVPFYSSAIVHKSTFEWGKHPNLKQPNKSSSTKLWSFLNYIGKFSNLWHPNNPNVLSCDKSTIESNKCPNSKQLNKSSFTKLWNFLNSTGRFSNLWHSRNWNVLSCHKSIIESGKHPNSKQLDKSSSTH